MGRKTQHPIPKTPKIFIWRRLLAFLGLVMLTGLLVIFINVQSFAMFTHGQYPTGTKTYSLISHSPTLPLPSPKTHPLPTTLAQWQDRTNSGDYFSQVAPTQVGYLVWSQFPVTVYIEMPTVISTKQAETWVNEVLQAVQEWSTYLPLQVVETSEEADITILRKAPPLQISPGNKFPRARSALTTYFLYTKGNFLYHYFTILLHPSQTGKYLLAAVRHELGHALGIWGHSQAESDVLYFSQVRNPPPISPRDINTLKRVYEQPTSLGWTLPKAEGRENSERSRTAI
ncbi:matrixin family metalloprotease [Chlorogloeopsis sp. ULAP01]|uniref:matrixin family metalloprotease n=1 Tax=Chlorogloeopsis sp. ULAP01 TaxID=3056483 RepID=UPI0025AA41A7|nr:matrixin family metalloprotease [Chlorogloeopsis sp. ULAP01]MDM9381725.1 matrixin family metalloprotease [Chlorogloeopsis sp. ULAP01]